MKSHKQKSGSVSKRLWIVPVIILLIISLSGGAYYAVSRLQEYQAERQRIQEEEARIQAVEQAALEEKRTALNRETFYDGIFINGQPVGGQSRDAILKQLSNYEQTVRSGFRIQISLGDQKLALTPEQAGLAFDTEAVVKKAYETGRIATATGEKAQILERYAAVESLKVTPLKLAVKPTVDTERVRQQIIDWAASQARPAADAEVTGFDTATKTFKIKEATSGLAVDATAVAESVVSQMKEGKFTIDATLKGETITPKLNASALRSQLGLISTASTLAGSSSGASRDANISLIVKGLNGYFLKPGETFSFNGYFGKRTAEKGFKEAGGIKDGILIQELGGGICQPNTTLCQAVLKADLKVVERSPHSWPSAYTEVGLDATVSWPGPDFKFQNNTEYPIAIVASFKKPDIVISVYGRLLAPGVSISLVAEHNGYIKEAAPIYKVNNTLAPGKTVEIRKPHTGQRATAYKVWKKDGTVIKREVAFTSYYRPIQGIYEVGPAAPTSAPTQPTTATTGSTGTTGTTATTATTATTTSETNY